MALISRGSSGSEVKDLQEKLFKLKFLESSEAVSGSFDSSTEIAVKKFQAQRPWMLVDGVAGPMTFGEVDSSISVLDGEEALKEFSSASSSLDMSSLRSNRLLSLAIQRRLRGLGLYPGGKLIDGDFGPRSQAALKDFLEETNIPSGQPFQLTPTMAGKLLNTRQIKSVLDKAKNTANISKQYRAYSKFVGSNVDKLAFLDMGVQESPFKEKIYQSTQLLAEISLEEGKEELPKDTIVSNYPTIGSQPTEFTSSLDLGDDIAEACLCIGNFNDRKQTINWLGDKPLKSVECWSASKIIPILNVLCQIGDRVPQNPSNLILKNSGSTGRQLELPVVLVDICSYRDGIPSSNALSATLNSLERNRTGWIKEITGNNKSISFGGKYGFNATIAIPEIKEKSSHQPILEFQSEARGGNLISAYDLTRFMSLIGWHELLAETQQLPGISHRGIDQARLALGTDSARYVDVAIATLGLEQVVTSLTVFSKLGFGFSDPEKGGRNVTELVYTAFVQFIDQQNLNEPKPRSFALTLRSSLKGGGNTVSIKVDTAIATAVTEIIRRIVTDEIA